MTSNIGKKHNTIGFGNSTENINNELLESFDISFINRIDNIINFNYLTDIDIHNIIKKELDKLKSKYYDVNIKINDNIIDELTEESRYRSYGARKISTIIKNKIEPIIIDNIIENIKTININSLFSK